MGPAQLSSHVHLFIRVQLSVVLCVLSSFKVPLRKIDTEEARVSSPVFLGGRRVADEARSGSRQLRGPAVCPVAPVLREDVREFLRKEPESQSRFSCC